MKSALKYIGLVSAMFAATLPAPAKDIQAPAGVPITTVVTANVDDGKRAPEIQQADVVVKKSKQPLQVLDWVAARGDRAGLELFILIDDANTTSLGMHLEDLRKFINAQPETTYVGVAYARNAVVQVAQELTNDHARAARALRLPMGSAGTYGSPYLSLDDLTKRWPASMNRHEVLLVTDGIDRAHRERNALLNPDVDTAAMAAQRTGTMIHTIYHPGIGHWQRNFFQANSGLNALAKLSDATGGESYSLGIQGSVSFAPYLESLQKVLDNQYLLTVSARPDKKAGLQYISVGTEVAGVDLSVADAFWVPAVK
jgi:hypothetical protein